MTSKNLSYKRFLILDAIKRRIWFFVLVVLGLFFTLPVGLTMSLQSAHRYWAETPAELAREIANVLGMFFSAEGLNTYLLLFLGFAAAIVFYGYLHKKKKVDFYHSQPVTLKNLFFVNYIAGALSVVLPYIFFYLASLCIVAFFGDINYIKISTLIWGLVLPIVGFFASYSVGILAATLTGNGIIQGLLTLYFILVIPVAIGEWVTLMSTFFVTYIGDSVIYDQIVYWSSPLFRNSGIFNISMNNWLNLIVSLVSIALLTIAALHFYRIRKGESAGSAFAFPKLIPLIKYPLIILGSIGFAIFLSFIGEDESGLGFWMVFGAVFGGLLVSRGLEVIIDFDVKAVKKHWGSLVASFGIVALILGGFALDITKYDTYCPKANDVKAVSIYVDDLNMYGEIDPAGYDDAFGFKKVFLTGESEIKAALGIAQNGITYLDYSEEQNGNYGVMPLNGEVSDSSTLKNSDGSQKIFTAATITYELKNGREVTRRYTGIEKQETLEYVETLLMSKEYKEKQLEFLGSDGVRFNNVTYSDTQFYIGKDVLKKVNTEAIKEALRSDIKNTTLNVLENEVAVGSITFEVMIRDAYNGTEYATEMYIPIYSDYTNVLELLANWGYDYESYGVLKTDMISNMQLEIADKNGNLTQNEIEASDYEKELSKTVPSHIYSYFGQMTSTSCLNISIITSFGASSVIREYREFWS